ncbi:hypothetical protein METBISCDRAFT_22550 [Metschnikowia bicuspidata]|uniref:BIR-domain-containing protein n=1 Tax=Metschnikowia bicuspidata TaxID=27322 RepID=A0A4P9ZE41_9ASCO|nr:hypothetical protein METBISCDRAFT_22550 [Metschnikowia bicuspidata]
MADSGFYYTPTQAHLDRVTCFWCNKKEYGFHEVEYISEFHCRNNLHCAFSLINMWLAKFVKESNKSTFWQRIGPHVGPVVSDPLSEDSCTLREATFKDLWKFDSHNTQTRVTSRGLAEAGFYYSPVEVNDDRVICMYCDCPLSDWDLADDPLKEHYENSFEYCYFLEKHRATAGTVVKQIELIEKSDNDIALKRVSNASQKLADASTVKSVVSSPKTAKTDEPADAFDFSIEELQNHEQGTIFEGKELLPRRFTRKKKQNRIQSRDSSQLATRQASIEQSSMPRRLSPRRTVKEEIESEKGRSNSSESNEASGPETTAQSEIKEQPESDQAASDNAIGDEASDSDASDDEPSDDQASEIASLYESDSETLNGNDSDSTFNASNSSVPQKRSGPNKEETQTKTLKPLLSKSQFDDDGDFGLDMHDIERILNSPKKAKKVKVIQKKDGVSPSVSLYDDSNQNLGDYDEGNLSFMENHIKPAQLLQAGAKKIKVEGAVIPSVPMVESESSIREKGLAEKPNYILPTSEVSGLEILTPSVSSAKEADTRESDGTALTSNKEMCTSLKVDRKPQERSAVRDFLLQDFKVSEIAAENSKIESIVPTPNDTGVLDSFYDTRTDFAEDTGPKDNQVLEKTQDHQGFNKPLNIVSRDLDPRQSHMEDSCKDENQRRKTTPSEPKKGREIPVQFSHDDITTDSIVLENSHFKLSKDRISQKLEGGSLNPEPFLTMDQFTKKPQPVTENVLSSFAAELSTQKVTSIEIGVDTTTESSSTTKVNSNHNLELSPSSYCYYQKDLEEMNSEFVEDLEPAEIDHQVSEPEESKPPEIDNTTNAEELKTFSSESTAETKVRSFEIQDDSLVLDDSASELRPVKASSVSPLKIAHNTRENAEGVGSEGPKSKTQDIENLDNDSLSKSVEQTTTSHTGHSEPVSRGPQTNTGENSKFSSFSGHSVGKTSFDEVPSKLVAILKEQPKCDASLPRLSFDNVDSSTPQKVSYAHSAVFPAQPSSSIPLEVVSKFRPISLEFASARVKALEDAIERMSEISNTKFELHNDAGGYLTEFIAAMPEKEENMSIQDWIQENSAACEQTVKSICDKIILRYLDEFENLIAHVENMATVD